MDIDINNAVRSAAMLATFHTTAWSGRARDGAGATAAAAASGADPRAFSTYKNLMYGADDKLRKLINIQSSGRKQHLENTLPWGGEHERGLRMLPVVNWQPYMRKIAVTHGEFKIALDEFVAAYPADVQKAMVKLNIKDGTGLYPDPAEVRAMFSMRPSFTPIPEGAQFKGLPEGVAAQLGASYEARMHEQFLRAVKASLERVAETLDTFAKRLDAGTATIYASTWQAAVDTPSILRSFNVVKDPKIDALASKIQTRLINESSLELLRATEAERTRVSGVARELLKDLQTMLA